MPTPDPTILQDLAVRLEAATGPDREIDIALWRLFVRPDAPQSHVPLPWAHRYTESVDDALSLAEQEQPKRWYEVLNTARRELAERFSWHMCFARPGQLQELPRAICLALVRALQQQEAAHGH